MDRQSPVRRPLAPTSINAILASPLPSPTKCSTINASLQLPPISLNRPTNNAQFAHKIQPQCLPRLDEAISSALRQPLPAGMRSGAIPHPTNSHNVRPRPSTNIPLSTASKVTHLPPANTLPALPTLSAIPPKRKADDISTSTPTHKESNESHRYESRENCDQIRRKIKALLNSGDMEIAEFVHELNCDRNAYSRFMQQNGPDMGYESDVYIKAWTFFKDRETRPILPTIKKAKKEDGGVKSDTSSIKLEGEDTTSVQVYDSCDEIRKKIRAHLAQPSITQAGFLREIAKTYSDGRKIQSKVLNDFLGKRGKYVGNTTAVYYSSYIFFEKLRIREGKEKSKHREEMEAEWMEEGGIDVKHRDNGKAYYFKGS